MTIGNAVRNHLCHSNYFLCAWKHARFGVQRPWRFQDNGAVARIMMHASSMRFCGFILLLLLLAAPHRAPAHETSDMQEVQQLATDWLTGLMNDDGKALAALLTDDATADVDLASSRHFDNGTAFLAYLRPTLREFSIRDIRRDVAVFQPRGAEVRIGPLVTSNGAGAKVLFAWFLDARETTAGWKISHVTVNLDGVPRELVQLPRPEQHEGRPVRFRMLDAVKGTPLAGRVNIRDAEERYWPPRGHPYEIPIGWREDVGGDVKVGERVFAYVEPEFTVDLSAGHYRIEAHHGLEYTPRTLEFDIDKDSATIEVRLERWVDMNSTGWYSGDTHVHFESPRAASLEGRGEGVNSVNILAAKWGNLITNATDFSGAPDPVSTADNIVYVNEEARHGFLGHTALLGLKQLVFPLSWGSGPLTGVPGGSDYPPMAYLADETHRQGGFVSWAHFPGPRGEVAVDIALNKIDSVDVLTWGDPLERKNGEPSRAEAWYGFLNCGFRLPITAGTDKMFNTQIIGTPRVYVKVDGRFGYDSWLDGIRHGRTFATTGPILSLQVDNEGIGATLTRTAGSFVSVSATAISELPMSRLEIVQNGIVVGTASSRAGDNKISLATRIKVKTSSWLAARVISTTTLPYQTVYLDRSEPIPVFAHTSPVYIDVPGMPRRSAADAARFIKWIDEGIEWLRKHAEMPQESEREEMISLFEQARAVYVSQAGAAAAHEPR